MKHKQKRKHKNPLVQYELIRIEKFDDGTLSAVKLWGLPIENKKEYSSEIDEITSVLTNMQTDIAKHM